MDEAPEGELTSIEKIEKEFPALTGGKGYKDASDASIEYNCLAWALGINWTRYDPIPRCAGYYWFPGVEREWSDKAIRTVFRNHGYSECDSFDVEDGYEKVVFYVDASGVPQHFARQLENGKWASKLGDLNDIEHDTLESIICEAYGHPRIVMKRRRQGIGEQPEGEEEP